jgi:glutaredoxin
MRSDSLERVASAEHHFLYELRVGSNLITEGAFPMTAIRTIEIFSAGCPACEETVQLVNRIACNSCEITVLDMRDTQVAARAKNLGIRSVPAVIIDGDIADCCVGRGPDEATLRAAGLGQPLS